jgi:pivalyl-CoA mutase large subunit
MGACPRAYETARIAVNTQNILREEAHLTDVSDPLGGSYYVELLTDEMERRMLVVMAQVDAAGGMYAAVEQGVAQKIIGAPSCALQERIESGEQAAVKIAQDGLAAAANDTRQNIFERVIVAAEAGCTHGEICATLRRELGFGQPLVMV